MARIGFHASHEQFTPSELLRAVQAAEAMGFAAGSCSDHFAPWSEKQGQSGYAWSWLGAALQGTALPFGVVTAPGQRQHPALVAQAAATLGEMYPGRFWMALGSGEAINESITGERWLPKPERRARLGECVEVIRALFAGETVTHRGRVTVEGAKLYTRPAVLPKLYAAAVSAETAAWAGAWADGLITVAQPREALAATLAAFERGGGAGKPRCLQVHVAYARDEAEALRSAHEQWAFGALPPALTWELPSPALFDAATKHIRPEDMRQAVRVSADLGQHAAWIAEDLAMGFDEVYVHEVGRDQLRTIEAFGEHVLPQLRARP